MSSERRAEGVTAADTMTTRQKVVRFLKIFVGAAAAAGLAGYLFTRLAKKGVKNEKELKALINQTIEKIPVKKRFRWRDAFIRSILSQILLYKYAPQYSLHKIARGAYKTRDSHWKRRFQSIGNTTPSDTWTRRHVGVRWANDHGGSLSSTRIFNFKPAASSTATSSILNTVKSKVKSLWDSPNVPIDSKWANKRI